MKQEYVFKKKMLRLSKNLEKIQTSFIEMSKDKSLPGSFTNHAVNKMLCSDLAGRIDTVVAYLKHNLR